MLYLTIAFGAEDKHKLVSPGHRTEWQKILQCGMTSSSTYGSYQQLPQPQETQGNKQNWGCPWHQGSLEKRYKCVFVSLTCLKAGALKFPYWIEVKGNKNKNPIPGEGVRTDAVHPRESQDPCRGRPGDTTPGMTVRIFPRLKGLKPYVRDEHFWRGEHGTRPLWRTCKGRTKCWGWSRCGEEIPHEPLAN